MSQAVVSLPAPQLSLSLPSNALHKTLEQSAAKANPKSALAPARRAKINSGLLKSKRITNKQLVPKFVRRIRGFASDERVGITQEEGFNGFSASMDVVMKMNPYRSPFLGATLEKKKEFKFGTTQTIKEFSSPKLADGGGGGDIGKKNSHGGGDGGDDGGDDDDFFGDFDEGDEGGDEGGWFRRRIVFQEIFDRKMVEAILHEWHRTMNDLPAGLLQACEMGLVSTAQMVRYLSINGRPTISRAISRSMPQAVSRAFIGRMIADPAFIYKMCLEQATTICSTAWWELRHRKERIRQEWDLALINVLTVSLCNAAIVWTLAPCRSYGTTFRFNLQNTLQKLPNNIFERGYPLREFDLQKRIHCFFYKAAELCMVGMAAGAANGALSKLCASQKEGRTSVLIPSVSTSSLGYGAFLGLSGNLRYQLLYGVERVINDNFDAFGLVISCSTALRILNIQIGDITRLGWLALDVDPLFEAETMSRAYNRPSEVSKDASSNWFIAQKAIISGFFGGKHKSEDNAQKAIISGFFGGKHKSEDNVQESSTPSGAPRRRIVRRKVTARS